MKPFGNFLLTALAATALAACDGSADRTATPAADALSDSEVAAPADGTIGTVPTEAAVPTGERLADGAPTFATLYPEATLDQPVVLANGAEGPGGLAEFTTAASPDDVIDHYRRLADSAGLKPVMAMNQGNARAFAALDPAGAEVQVVASPDEAGATSVQLTWKNGH